jgi:hypothetical protein
MKVKTKSGEEIDIQFMGTFFESFEGTEEELQKLMSEIIEKVQDETLYKDSEPVDIIDVTPEQWDEIKDNPFGDRKLQ